MSLTTLSACAPSPRRIVVTDVQLYLRGRTVAPVPPAWPAKDPLQATIRELDFSPVLRGRTINAVDVEASGVVAVSWAFVGAVVSIVLEGGEAATTAQVTARVFADDGMDEVALVLLPIVASLTLPGIDQSSPSLVQFGDDDLFVGDEPVVFGRQD